VKLSKSIVPLLRREKGINVKTMRNLLKKHVAQVDSTTPAPLMTVAVIADTVRNCSNI